MFTGATHILIIETGSTKTDSVLIDSQGNKLSQIRTEGFNPNFHHDDFILKILGNTAERLPALNDGSLIFFYGAGCPGGENNARMNRLLKNVWKNSVSEVSSDLLATARALFRKQAGIACILGTGSNSCLYDGDSIIENIPPLGYILGDEGSGAALGKELLNLVFKKSLPTDLCSSFFSEYRLSLSDVTKRVYSSESPSKFLASFSPFIKNHIHRNEIRQMVETQFELFFSKNILAYKGCRSLPLKFTGSIALHFKEILFATAGKFGLTVNEIVATPLDNLIEYHKCSENE